MVPSRAEFRCDLSYMGTYAADRQQKLDTLLLEPARQLADHRFVLAGSLYPWSSIWPENVRRFEHVSPAEHPALYSSSRTTLNLTREGMAARGGFCPSGRLFEAAACGTPILSDWFEGLDTFFAPGEEIFVVRAGDDVLSALRCPDSELAWLAQRARQRTLQEHTGMNWCPPVTGVFAGNKMGAGQCRTARSWCRDKLNTEWLARGGRGRPIFACAGVQSKCIDPSLRSG